MNSLTCKLIIATLLAAVLAAAAPLHSAASDSGDGIHPPGIAAAATKHYTWTGKAQLTRKNGTVETFTGSGDFYAADNASAYAHAYNQMCTIVEKVRNVGERYTATVQVTHR
jgi:hypothetical protein